MYILICSVAVGLLSQQASSIFTKKGRLYVGEYSIAEDVKEEDNEKPNMDINNLPGIVAVKDPYELPYVLDRMDKGTPEYHQQQTFRRYADGMDSVMEPILAIKRFDLSHPSLRRDYFANKNFQRGSIYFRIDESTPFSSEELYLLKKAMLDLEYDSCIRFFQTRDDDVAVKKIIFQRVNDDTCLCHRWTGGLIQHVKLGEDCFSKSHYGLAHQLLHALGFQHTHNSFDRDRHVTFTWENIDPRFQDEFMLKLPMAATLALPFDYDSVMAVPLYYGTRNGGHTIVPKKESGRSMGDLSQISKQDRLKLRLLYDDECDVRENFRKLLDNKDVCAPDKRIREMRQEVLNAIAKTWGKFVETN